MPDPLASDAEKLTPEYGLEIAKYIEQEWFNGGIIANGCRFMGRRKWIEDKRLFVRGEQDAKPDKDLLSRGNYDLDYLNLDWTQINLAEKFCNIVSNGIKDDYYMLDIRAFDRISVKLKQDRMNLYRKNMRSLNMLLKARDIQGIDLTPTGFIPEDEEELQLYMEIEDRPKIEIAEEIMIDFVKKPMIGKLSKI